MASGGKSYRIISEAEVDLVFNAGCIAIPEAGSRSSRARRGHTEETAAVSTADRALEDGPRLGATWFLSAEQAVSRPQLRLMRISPWRLPKLLQ